MWLMFEFAVATLQPSKHYFLHFLLLTELHRLIFLALGNLPSVKLVLRFLCHTHLRVTLPLPRQNADASLTPR